jgi:hypothetical protein
MMESVSDERRSRAAGAMEDLRAAADGGYPDKWDDPTLP